MGKYISLFKNPYNEFVRVFIFGNKYKLVHFKSKLKISSQIFDSNTQFDEILNMLIGLHLPTEIVFYHRSMACKSFPANISVERNINSIIKHTFDKSHCNTVFYTKLSHICEHSNVNFLSNKKSMYGLCTCDVLDELSKLLLSNVYSLNIFSICVFPLWIVSAFCLKYKYNSLSPTLFVVEYLGYLNIILMCDGCVTYNRSGSIETFKKDVEIQSTINHINNAMNININELIIYEFGNDVVDSFSFRSELRMKIVSTLNNFRKKPCKQLENKILKIASLSFAGVVCSDTLISTCKVYNCNNEIDMINNLINQVDTQVVHNIDSWQVLFAKNVLNQPDYRQAIKDYTLHRVSKLQNIVMCWDEESNTILVNENNKVFTDNLIVNKNI